MNDEEGCYWRAVHWNGHQQRLVPKVCEREISLFTLHPTSSGWRVHEAEECFCWEDKQIIFSIVLQCFFCSNAHANSHVLLYSDQI